MRVLVVGSGGREHAICLSLAADPAVDTIICAPGNPGIATIAATVPLDVADPHAVAALAVGVGADLVVIGPEVPLVAGAADAVRGRGIDCFGPSAAAAAIEGSKAFAKDVMAAACVPTARAVVCRSAAQAAAALDVFGPPYVVKDDALAAGKGVVVTDDRAAALAHATGCRTVVVEEYLAGPEVSLFCVIDGETVLPLLPAQDFKRVGDGDVGPNTGGMGAYCPLPWAPPDLTREVLRSVVRPTLAELARRGTPYSGVLYVGLALTSGGPAVIEFNARFGDPETQAVLALLETPLGQLLRAAATGRLDELPPLRWRDRAAVTVVVSVGGYPDAPQLGGEITGADRPGVLHAGTTRRADGTMLATGGRVVSATATGPDLDAARSAAYDVVQGIHLEGSHFRTDIALAAARGEIVAPIR